MATIQLKNSSNSLIYIILIASLLSNITLMYIMYKAKDFKDTMVQEIAKNVVQVDSLRKESALVEQEKVLTLNEITSLKEELEKIEKLQKKGKATEMTVEDALKILKGEK